MTTALSPRAVPPRPGSDASRTSPLDLKASLTPPSNPDPKTELVSIVTPTYNERDNVPILYQLILCAFNSESNPRIRPTDPSSPRRYEFELVVVDDNSPDGTQEAVEQLQRLYGAARVVLVRRPCKLGLGSAYLHGAQAARGDWVVLMDADLSHHPRYVLDFLAAQCATGSDIVTGTRYARGGGVSGWNWKRKLTSRGANLLASFVLGARVSDLTGSFRLYRRAVLTRLLELTQSRGYAFQMEVMVRAEREGLKIAEVPIVFVDRLFGESKLGLSEYILFVKGLFGLMLV